MIKKVIKNIKKLDAEVLNLMIFGLKASFGISVLASLILLFYMLYSKSYIVFKSGIILFKTSLIFACSFFICAISTNIIKADLK